MNRRGSAVVFLFMTGACVAVNGGAVELEWTVRTDDAQPTDCQTQALATVSLCYEDCDQLVAGACAGASHCPFASFPCDRRHGATDFSIPPGRKAFSISVFCGDGRPAGVRVPEPVVRDIIDGNVTQLNALLISVPANGGSGCI
jgi:hypothetical protein